MYIVKIQKTRENVEIPKYETNGSVGLDLRAEVENAIEIRPNETVLIGTGIKLELPQGVGAFIYARSGLATKQGLVPKNCVGVVDSDYRGEVMVALCNTSTETQIVQPKDRIAQLVIQRTEQVVLNVVQSLEETQRGDGGFGSTGK